jgi:hypothetical protein
VVAWAQFTSGMASPILGTPSISLPHLESKWLTLLQGYLASINAALYFAYRSHRTLFIRSQYGYIKCRRSSKIGHYRETGTTTLQDLIPTQAEPVEAAMTGQHGEWIVTHITKMSSILAQKDCPFASFDEFLLTLDVWEYDLLRHSILFADAFTISDDLSMLFLAGSDGSKKYGTDGAFGWMLSNESGERSAAGMGPSRGWMMDSYRAECSGMLSILRFLIRLGEYTFRVNNWRGAIRTNSWSMLEKLFGRHNVQNGDSLTADK